jgi:hypothetical protein
VGMPAICWGKKALTVAPGRPKTRWWLSPCQLRPTRLHESVWTPAKLPLRMREKLIKHNKGSHVGAANGEVAQPLSVKLA